LGIGKRIEVGQHGRAELKQTRIGHLHLRLHPDDPSDVKARSSRRELIKEGGLSDSGLTPYDESRTLAGARRR
jgi:hypothetical protein